MRTRAPRTTRTTRIALAATALLLVAILLHPAAASTAACGTAQVTFDRTSVSSMTGNAADKGALIATIANSWRRYLAMDVSGYTPFLARGVRKMSSRWGANGVQQGASAVAAALPAEWSAFERLAGVVAENFTIKKAELWSDGSNATALYWVNVKGGARWCYTDEGLVLQAFTKTGGSWRIAHQTDSWNLDYDFDKGTPGRQTFPFDWVTPVKNLSAEVNFYRRFAGPPEYVSATRASFNLKGAHFILDADKLGGIAQITAGKPNGWAVLPVDDVATERARLKAAGVKFLAGGATFLMDGPDPYAVALDPSGNPFVITQRIFTSTGSVVPAAPTGFTGADRRVAAAKNLATKWLRTDGAGLQAAYGAVGGRYFDDTRTHIRGLEKGSALASVLPGEYWAGYDRTSGGLLATMGASSVATRPLGARSIESHLITLTGTGPHPFRGTAFVTNLFDANNKPLLTMVVQAEIHSGTALSLDYAAYPEKNLEAAESFYANVVGMGKPYADTGYFGWWADSGVVFGIYVADPTDDGLPRANVPSGYMSFWVSSAKATYDTLKAGGSTFPLIPAINSRKGVDSQPGYTQVLATDPDGNTQAFTEYTRHLRGAAPPRRGSPG